MSSSIIPSILKTTKLRGDSFSLMQRYINDKSDKQSIAEAIVNYIKIGHTVYINDDNREIVKNLHIATFMRISPYINVDNSDKLLNLSGCEYDIDVIIKCFNILADNFPADKFCYIKSAYPFIIGFEDAADRDLFVLIHTDYSKKVW